MPVYIIRAGDAGPVKIGWTDDVEARRKQIQVSHHEPLCVVRLIIDGRRQTERWLHKRFAALRLVGEWFQFDPDMLVVEPSDLEPLRPNWRKRKKRRPEKRVSWQMCWSGNPCTQCLGLLPDLRCEAAA